MKNILSFLVHGLALATMAGCASGSLKGRRAPANEDMDVNYVHASSGLTPEPADMKLPGEVAAGYLVQLSCVADKSLNGKFRIEFDGELKLPHDVNVQTRRLTIKSLQERIVEAYKPIIKNPRIKVVLVEKMYWVQVNGLVEKPGRYLVKNNATLDELIGLAGGLQKSAESKGPGTPAAKFITINQPDSSSVSIKLADYYAGTAVGLVPKWQGGDHIFVQSERDGLARSLTPTGGPGEVQIYGQVQKPGEYAHKDGADFFHYLAKSGGPTGTADLSNIEVIRGPSGGRQSESFELGDTGDVPVLANGDMVIVHAQKPSSTVLTSVLAVVNTVASVIMLGIVASAAGK